MRKKVKKALVCAAAAVLACGLTVSAACSGGYYKADKLDGDFSGNVVSNGGFAVEKGNYVYFINGIESNTAVNSYGDVEKGALLRISKTDLAAGNYSNADTVVPLIMYSGSYDGGIFIYGDYVYYSTPSAARDSGGETLNSRLEFKRTKLDGTETMTDFYFQSENTSIEYRFVEVDGTVYLMYVVNETLYGTEAHDNIHSVNLETGEDTVLAYNVSGYFFDDKDLTNPYIYYTMSVSYNLGTSNEVEADYNQVYRVRADAENDADRYDFSYVEDFDAEEDPLYINNGEFVFDGRGSLSGMTQFNYGYNAETDEDPSSDDANTLAGYTYTIISYENGTLYYTRSYSGDSTPILLYTNDEEAGAENWNPVTGNPTATDDYNSRMLLLNASSISGYTFIADDDGVPVKVMYSESAGSGYALMSADFDKDKSSITYGGLTNTFPMTTTSAEVTVLTTSKEEVDGEEYNFIYYGVTGEGSGYTVYRMALGGSEEQYTEFPADESTSNYDKTQILDIEVASSWYMPEIIAGHLFFASETTDMVDYEYVMVFDLRDANASGAENVTMSNADLKVINELYDSVIGNEDSVIADIDAEEFENLPNALRYAFYTRDKDYLADLINQWVEAGEDEEYLYSEESAQLYLDFIAATGDYEDFGAAAGYEKTVNGEKVYATSRDYYYNMVGFMSEEDEENYVSDLRTDYLPAEPEEELTWFEGLSTGEKAGFIIGVCVGGLIIIAAAVLIPLLVIRKKKKTLPQYSKARIKVDTTDDKNIDVYGGEDSSNGGENA